MLFDWDPQKARANLLKHGVSFGEAAECFEDALAIVLADRTHPERENLIGTSERRRLVFTVFIEHAGDVIRIISARKATPAERRRYEEGDL